MSESGNSLERDSLLINRTRSETISFFCGKYLYLNYGNFVYLGLKKLVEREEKPETSKLFVLF